MNRRQFLGASAAGAGAVLLGSQFIMAGDDADWPAKMEPVNIYKVFVGRTGGIYLSRTGEEIDKFNKHLAKLEDKLGDVKFIGGELVPTVNIDDILGKIAQADGVLMFHLSGHGGGAPAEAMNKIVNLGLPTAVFSQPFSGHGWMYFPQWRKAGKKVVLLPTSDWSELDGIVKLMRVGPHLSKSKYLL